LTPEQQELRRAALAQQIAREEAAEAIRSSQPPPVRLQVLPPQRQLTETEQQARYAAYNDAVRREVKPWQVDPKRIGSPRHFGPTGAPLGVDGFQQNQIGYRQRLKARQANALANQLNVARQGAPPAPAPQPAAQGLPRYPLSSVLHTILATPPQ
jgi:hypothetical protein